MKNEFIMSYNKTMFTLGFIYGGLTKAMKLKLGREMFSKQNMEFMHEVYKDEFKLYFN